MKLLKWVLVSLLCGGAWADPRAAIAKEYSRATEAMKLKYVDGIQSIRSHDFQCFDKEGAKLDLGVERTRTEQFLQPALRVDETLKIVSLDQKDASHAVCEVVYETKVVSLNRAADKEYEQVLVTRNRDEWVLTAKGWKLQLSRVLDQEFKK